MSFGGTTMEDDKIEIEEASNREELISQADIAKIAKMTKEDLQNYSHSRLGKKLDLSRRSSLLKIDVITMVKNRLKLPLDEKGEGVEETSEEPLKEKVVEFVFEPSRRRVFVATSELKKRTDLIHCWLVDKDGKVL
jgi:hypothetical protein